jgi:hypothetical protein
MTSHSSLKTICLALIGIAERADAAATVLIPSQHRAGMALRDLATGIENSIKAIPYGSEQKPSRAAAHPNYFDVNRPEAHSAPTRLAVFLNC